MVFGMRIFTFLKDLTPQGKDLTAQGPRTTVEMKSCFISKKAASLLVDHAVRAIDCPNGKGVEGLMLCEIRADMGTILG